MYPVGDGKTEVFHVLGLLLMGVGGWGPIYIDCIYFASKKYVSIKYIRSIYWLGGVIYTIVYILNIAALGVIM